jgi:uncharacterized damage-inducible protein DinB
VFDFDGVRDFMAITGTIDSVLTSVLAGRWKAASGKFEDLARTIPDGRFESELVSGARTCGDVLRHVAYWNRYIADSLNGRKADDNANELSRDDYPDRPPILAELERTNREIANGMSRNLDAKALELICMAFEHLSEHYGQLVVYARLLGVIPPASRP